MGAPSTGRSMADRRRTTVVLGPSPAAELTDTSADLPGVLLPVTGADQVRGVPSTAAHRRVQEVRLPVGVEQLLVDVVADGFTLYCCGPKAAPNALVACYEWERCVDLLTIRDFDRVITARVPTRGRRVDIFAPEVVVWAYEGPPQHAVRALLELVHPEHPDAPTAEYPAPAGLRVPRTQQRPMTIQPPSPGRAGGRAARLTTTMSAHGGDRAVSTAVHGETGKEHRLAVG